MRHGGGLRRGDMPRIEVGDVLEFYGGDEKVIDWAHKPFNAQLCEPEEYLLLMMGVGDKSNVYRVAYLDGKRWRHGECIPQGTVCVYGEDAARRMFREKAARNNFAIQVR